jgi:uncharacterized phage infection (PIP) family protein YhgE
MSEKTAPPQETDRDKSIGMTVECLDRFARNFETSARRWELIVYPSLFAFIVLAAYGFFLIYHLTSDIAIMARHVSKLTLNMESIVTDLNAMTGNMNAITINMNDMSKNMHTVAARMGSMSDDMGNISQKINLLEPMQASIHSLDNSTRSMSYSTDHMRYSVMDLNRGINQSTGPMQNMNSFMPFW